MKKIALIIVMAFMVAASSAWAANGGVKNNKAIKMQSNVYGAQIDSKVAFYQKRLYLVDSEYKLLADIGKDAVKRISYLKTNRANLVKKMIDSDVTFTRTKMDSFLGRAMNNANLTTMFVEAYSSGN